MRSRHLILITFLSLSTGANAAVLTMNWMVAPDAQTMAMSPGETTDIGIYVNLLAGESVTSLDFGYLNLPTGIADNLDLVNVAPVHPFFQAFSSLGPLDSATTQVNLFPTDVLPAPDPPNGPGKYLLATTTIQFLGGAGGVDAQVMFNRHPAVLDEAGQSFIWHATYGAMYSGYIGYGDFGHPGFNSKCGGTKCGPEWAVQAPLIVTEIPEPTAAALLGVLATALLVRRQRIPLI